MAITYSAQAGTQITSPAMSEALPSQTQQTGNNTVVVSNTLGNIGNGQIGNGTNGVGDSYVGRLLIINLGGTEQVRRCTADAAGTGTTRILTVSEDWTTNPVATTDTIYVAYELADIEDGGAGGGIQLNSKTGFWEITNLLTINAGGLLQMMDAAGVELDDQGNSVNLIVDGYLFSGYINSSANIAGVQITSYNNATGEPGPQIQSGGELRAYDTLFWSQLVGMQFEGQNGNTSIYKRCKWAGFSDELHLYDSDVEDCAVSGLGATTDIVRVDAGTVCNGLVLSDIEKLDSAADTTTETIGLEGVLFVGVPGYVDVRQNKTWNLIDPIWNVTTYTQLTWTGTATGNELNDRRSIKATVQEADGTLLQNALVNIYENTQLADLVLELTTDANGYAEDSFIYRKHATNSVTTTYGGHALQVGKWLYTPLVFTQPSDQKFNGVITLSADANIVQTTQATAKSDGSGVTWNEDTNPSELFDFTGGSGTLADGMILTFSPSGAVGTITKSLDGDSVAGTIHLKTRNGTAIANGDTFSRTGGTAGTFSGTYTNNTKQPFSIWIDGNAKSYQTLYDYYAAIMTETTLTAAGEIVWEWCRDGQAQPLYSGAAFSTERSNGKGIIIVNTGAGTVSHFTDDAGNTWTPPTSVTLQVTVKDESRVAIQNAQTSLHLLNSPFTQLMNEDTLSTGVASEPYAYTGDVEAVLKVRKSEDTDNPRYQPESQIVTITSTGLNQSVTLKKVSVPI